MSMQKNLIDEVFPETLKILSSQIDYLLVFKTILPVGRIRLDNI